MREPREAKIRRRGMTAEQRADFLLKNPPMPASTTNDAQNHNRLIRHIEGLQREMPNIILFLFMRGSTHEQREKRNVQNRLKLLRNNASKRGLQIVSKYAEVGSGGRPRKGRQKLIECMEAAQRYQAEHPDLSVVVLTDSKNRIIRGANFNRYADSDVVTVAQWQELEKISGGVILATWLRPDSDAATVRSYETNVPTARRKCGEASWSTKKAGGCIPRP